MNSFLIICILTLEDFKNWIFFPVCLQAAIDIVGPGFASIAHNVISLRSLRSKLENKEYFSSRDFEILKFVDGNLGCSLTFFRSILNEYTSGLCVLVSAFLRYCLICHPTASISSEENMKRFSLAIIPAIALILTLTFIHMRTFGRQIYPTFNTNSNEGWNKFVANCKYFTYRNNIKQPILSRDILTFFCLPASIAAFLYIRIFIVLRGRERNENRNRNLIVAFLLNYFLWVLCWTTYYTMMSFNLVFQKVNKPISERTFLDSVKERLSSNKENVCLLYSQLNPVFFLIILKPFQKKFLNVLGILFCSDENRLGVSKNQQNHRQIPKLKPEKAENKKVVLNKELQTLTFIVFLVVSSIVFNTAFGVDINISSKQAKDESLASKLQIRSVQKKQVHAFLLLQEVFVPDFEDPRHKCGVRRGSFSMENKRCYFLTKHNVEKKLNLSEQAELCRSQYATLASPRNFEEAGYLFRYYIFECGHDCRKNVSFRMNHWFIRLGFQKVSNGTSFTTFDSNERVVSGYNYSSDGNSGFRKRSTVDNDYHYEYENVDYYVYEYDYDYDYDYFALQDLLETKAFNASAVCLTYRYKVFPCLAKMKLPVTICMFEFSSSYHIPPILLTFYFAND